MPVEPDTSAPWRHPAFAEMRREIESLREENEWLRKAIVPVDWLPKRWKLTPDQTRLVVAIATAPGVISKARLRLALGGFERDTDDKVLEVQLSHARTKLRPYGVEIVTIYGIGLLMPPESREIVTKAISALQAGESA